MAQTPYCTKEDVKLYCVTTGVNTVNLDSLLDTLLIPDESALVDNYLNVPIEQGTYTNEVYSGEDTQRIAPRQYPITAVASVTVDGQSYTQWDGTLGGTGFSFDKRFIAAHGFTFTQGWHNVVITYTAGYAAIPEDIKQATIELCAYRLQERTRLGMSSKGLSGEQTNFVTKDMPDIVKSRLNSYRSFVVSSL